MQNTMSSLTGPGLRRSRAWKKTVVTAGLLMAVVVPGPVIGQDMVPASLTLDEALRLAIRNNPRLQAARNDIAVADWNLNAAYGSWIPSASLSSSISWQGAGEQRFGSITADQLGFQDQPSFFFSSYSAGINYSLNGRTLMAPGQARRNRDATRAQVRSEESVLRLNVTRAYLEGLRQVEGLGLAEQELERARFNLRLARGRQEVGSGNAIDVQQAEVGVGRAEIALIQARTGVRTSRIQLLQQLGVTLAAEPVLETTFAVTEPLWSADDLYDMAVGTNPNLQALRAQEEASRYGVSMARSAYFPSLSLSAGISGFTRQASSTAGQEAQAIAAGQARIEQCRTLNGLLSLLPASPPPQDCSLLATPQSAIEEIRAQNDAFPFNFTRQPPSLGLTISIPVFQGLGRQRELESARAQLNDNRFLIREQELALRADIESRIAIVQTAYESALIEERNQALADEQLRLAHEQYRLGLSNFIALVEAETVKAQADRERVLSIFTYHDAVADLEAVVGTPLRNQ